MRRGLGVALLLLTVAPALPAQQSAIERGDAAWSRRADGQVGGRPLRAPIDQAVAAYEEALAAAPTDLEARWKLMRALFFLGEHVLTDREERLPVFTRGRDLGEQGLDQLAADVGGRSRLDELEPAELPAALAGEPQAARTYFWTAVHWGLWGRYRGKFAAAREGVAGKIRDYATASIALDETIENGGGHRILGRLHSEAPRIPFITGWIDRDLSVAELERCLAIAPNDLLTRLYWAEAILDHHPQRRQEALEMLRGIVSRKPDPAYLIEEMKAIADARQLLESS